MKVHGAAPATWVIALASVAGVLAAGTPAAAGAQEAGGLPAIESHTAGLERLDGFFPLFWDDDTGALWLEIGRLGVEVLYVNALAAGVGSNDIGLDRGQLGGSRIVRFERVGRKVLMVQPNYGLPRGDLQPGRAASRGRRVRHLGAVRLHRRRPYGRSLPRRRHAGSCCATSTASPIACRARTGSTNGRSAVYLPRTKAFPENTETGGHAHVRARGPRRTGRASAAVPSRRSTPSAEAVTVRQRQSFIALPDDGYTPRPYDPRAGYGAVSFVDYAAPLGEPMTRRYLRRHRLEKRDPSAADERGGRADRLLPGPRYAGADPLRAARRRALVEPGVRGGRDTATPSGWS